MIIHKLRATHTFVKFLAIVGIMSHSFTHDVFSPVGVYIHTSCVNCACLPGSPQASQPCPNPQHGPVGGGIGGQPPPRSMFGKAFNFFFGRRSSVDIQLGQLLEAMTRVEDSLVAVNTLVTAIIDMSAVEVMSSQSDRTLHHAKFEADIANNYKCLGTTNATRRCVVTNSQHPVQYMTKGAHLLALNQRRKMKIISMSSDDVWNWRNGLCLHKEIDRRLKVLDLVFLHDYLNDSFRVQVLYDDLLNTVIPGVTRGHLDGSHDQSPVTFGDINGRQLTLPVGVSPFRIVVLFIAYSGYNLALKSSRPHQVAINTAHSTQEWCQMFEQSHSQVPTESLLMKRFRMEA